MEDKEIIAIRQKLEAENFFHIMKTTHDLISIWRKKPHLRLGQLIWDALIAPNKHDMWFLTDEDFIKELEKYYDRP